jgi:hypothetical protein
MWWIILFFFPFGLTQEVNCTCSQPLDYWIPIAIDINLTLCDRRWSDILINGTDQPYWILAQAYLIAQLNIANGACYSSVDADNIILAELVLDRLCLNQSEEATTVLYQATVLDQYNQRPCQSDDNKNKYLILMILIPILAVALLISGVIGINLCHRRRQQRQQISRVTPQLTMIRKQSNVA